MRVGISITQIYGFVLNIYLTVYNWLRRTLFPEEKRRRDFFLNPADQLNYLLLV